MRITDITDKSELKKVLAEDKLTFEQFNKNEEEFIKVLLYGMLGSTKKPIVELIELVKESIETKTTLSKLISAYGAKSLTVNIDNSIQFNGTTDIHHSFEIGLLYLLRYNKPKDVHNFVNSVANFTVSGNRVVEYIEFYNKENTDLFDIPAIALSTLTLADFSANLKRTNMQEFFRFDQNTTKTVTDKEHLISCIFDYFIMRRENTTLPKFKLGESDDTKPF